MSELGKRISRIISKRLAPYLRSSGFKRKGRTFHRIHEDRIDVINIQGSKWNSGNSGEIAVNIGVYYPDLAQLIESWPVDGLPQEYDCTVNARLGMLVTGGKDFWWKISDRTDDEELSQELADALNAFGLPWIDSMSNLNSIKTAVPAFVAAGISLLQGNEEEARANLRLSYEEAPAASENAKKWGIKHGLEEA